MRNHLLKSIFYKFYKYLSIFIQKKCRQQKQRILGVESRVLPSLEITDLILFSDQFSAMYLTLFRHEIVVKKIGGFKFSPHLPLHEYPSTGEKSIIFKLTNVDRYFGCKIEKLTNANR